MTFLIGTPHAHGAGHYVSDNRCSGGRLQEADIQTCPHCQAVINLQAWKTAPIQNFCNRCMKPTCNDPGCVHDCIPWIKQLDQQLDATIKFQRFLKEAGFVPVSIPKPLIIR